MPIELKATFHPSPNTDDEYLGSASLIVADTIVIRGIAVLQSSSPAAAIALAFPSFGTPRRSYIQPSSRASYERICSVISDAVKDIRFSHAILSGSTEVSLSVSGSMSNPSSDTALFSLHIRDFCTLHGITARESNWPLPDGSKVAVEMPALQLSQPPGQSFTVFEGLITAREQADGSIEYTDHQQLINQLVRNEHQRMLEHPSHVVQDEPSPHVPIAPESRDIQSEPMLYTPKIVR